MTLLSSLTLALVLFAICATSLVCIAAFNEKGAKGVAGTAVWLSAYLPIVFLFFMFFRYPHFGVDSVVYYGIFKEYCSASPGFEVGREFLLSLYALNIGMLGLCDITYFTASWGGIIVIFVLLASALLKRYGYMAILLISFFGFELATNALRQGFSVVMLLLATALLLNFKGQYRMLSSLFFVLAALFHSSSALVILILIVSLLSWRIFIALYLLVGLAFWQGYFGFLSFIPGVERFLYEIHKYAAHESTDHWIRLLVFLSVVSIIVVPVFSINMRFSFRELMSDSRYSFVCKALLAYIPALSLPYFGYRLGYAIYAICLYIIFDAFRDKKLNNARMFVVFLVFNLVLLFAWASMSSMLSIDFLEL